MSVAVYDHAPLRQVTVKRVVIQLSGVTANFKLCFVRVVGTRHQTRSQLPYVDIVTDAAVVN